MSIIRKCIDPWFIALIGAIGIWWLIAGSVDIPASRMESLESGGTASDWLNALSSPSREVREYAKDHMLEALAPDEIRSVAVEAAQSDDSSIRLSGLWLLGQVDVPGTGEIATDYLDSDNSQVRIAALGVLARDPLPDARSHIIELVENSDSETKTAALKALGALKNPDDLPLFISNLGASSSDVRDAAEKAIAALAEDTEVVTELLIAARSPDLGVARAALRLLGEIGGPEALDGLFGFLEGGPVALTSDAATAIGKIGGDDAKQRALEIYITADTRIRAQAARVLGALGYREAAIYLWGAVRDEMEDFWVRYHSLGALATCGDEEMASDIIEYLRRGNHDPRLVRMGLEALGGMDGEDVLDLYDSIIAGETDLDLNRAGGNTALVAVISGLGKMDNDESRQRLRSLLESTSRDNLEIIMGLIRAFGKVGTSEDIDLLSELPPEEPVLRGVVGEAIRRIESRE